MFHKTIFTFMLLLLSCFATEAAMALPIVFWASDPIEPGDTVLFEGAGLGASPSVSFRRLSDERQGGDVHDGKTNAGVVLQSSDTSLKVSLPKSLSSGAYFYDIATPGGHATGILNAPTIYWAQGDAGYSASPGGWIRVFGRNIVRSPSAVLLLESGDGKTKLTLPQKDSNLWNAHFDLPANIATGSYNLRLWNGQGDSQSVATVGSLAIMEKPYLGAVVANVKSMGARGDGRTDDTAVFKMALSKLVSSGGGKLFVPRGTYLISDELVIPKNVSIRGEDETLSVLVLKDQDAPPDAFIFGESYFSIENLSILTSKHNTVISGGFLQNGQVIDDARVLIDHVTVRADMYRGHISPSDVFTRMDKAVRIAPGGQDTIRLGGGGNQITNSDIYGDGRSIFMLSPHRALVSGNHIMNGRSGWYSFTKPDGLIFENNEIVGADMQAEGGSINTLFSGQRAIAQNVYVYNNHISMVFGADAEGVTSDGPGGCYYGPISLVAGSAVASAPASPSGDLEHSCKQMGGLVVLNGRGVGEHALIQSIDGNEIHLDRTMPVGTDSTSKAVLIPALERYLVIGNTISDVGIGIQFYGSAWEQIAADNTVIRTGGIDVNSRFYRGGIQPSLYTQFINNKIIAGNVSTYNYWPIDDAVLQAKAVQYAPNTDPLVRGVVMRGNDLEGNARIDILGGKLPDPSIVDVIIEHNAIGRTDVGIRLDEGVSGAIVRENTFNMVSQPIVDLSRH